MATQQEAGSDVISVVHDAAAQQLSGSDGGSSDSAVLARAAGSSHEG